MKSTNLKRKIAGLICLLLTAAFTLISCQNIDTDGSLLTQTANQNTQDTEDNEDGVMPEEDGGGETAPEGGEESETSNTDSSNDGENPKDDSKNEDTEGVVLAAAKGLRSAVSIYCTFEVKSGTSSPWNPTPSTRTYYSTGAGVIYDIDQDGNAFIVTNYHVVYYSESQSENHISDQIYLYLYGLENENYAIPATFVGGSANYDIAVLRVDGNEIMKNAYNSHAAAAVSITDSDTAVPGKSVIAIGNPSSDELGGISVTEGIVSVTSEYITMSAVDGSGNVDFRVIRIDAPVNSGNSGGGLYTAEGELIGIVNAKYSSTDVVSVAYALPSNVVRAVADNIIDNCYQKDCESVMRCILGAEIKTHSIETSYDSKTGLFVITEKIAVSGISDNSAADGILQEGDIIKNLILNGTTVTVTRQYHLIDAMLDARANDTLTLVVIRGDEEITLEIPLSEDCLAKY